MSVSEEKTPLKKLLSGSGSAGPSSRTTSPGFMRALGTPGRTSGSGTPGTPGSTKPPFKHLLSNSLRTQVRSPGFSSRVSNMMQMRENHPDYVRPRPVISGLSSDLQASTSFLTPPRKAATFNRSPAVVSPANGIRRRVSGLPGMATNSIFFLFPFCENSLICRQINDPSSGKHYSLPSSKGFLS